MKKLAKWALEDFLSCAARFKDIHILGNYPEQTVEAKHGESFHDFAFRFFNDCDFKRALNTGSRREIEEIFKETVPTNLSEELENYYHNFVRFETNHLYHLKQVVSKNLVKKFFFPLDRELSIETKSFVGRIDRIDRLMNNEASVMEYKLTGWWLPTNIRREICFYAVLAKSTKMYREVHPVTHISCYNAKLDRFLFEKINRRTVIALHDKIEKLNEAIRTDSFPRKISGLCKYCHRGEVCLADVPQYFGGE